MRSENIVRSNGIDSCGWMMCEVLTLRMAARMSYGIAQLFMVAKTSLRSGREPWNDAHSNTESGSGAI